MKQQIKNYSITVVVVLVILAAGAGAFAYSGLYNIGADAPHTKPVFAVMQMVRARSIHLRSKDITVPNLEDQQLILKGAGQYAAMCTGCHLKPGMQDSESEIRPGFYPQPPNLSQVRIDPQDAFWVIKHGIKMSGMPAWGFSHDDATIWSMVAFLQKLPDLTPEQYKNLVAKAPSDEDMDMGQGGHHHGHGASADDDHDADAGGEQSHAHVHSHGNAAGVDEHAHAEAAPVADSAVSMDGLKAKAVPDAEAVAQAFHTALQTGDRQGVLTLLAPEVTVSEGGETQSHDEYAGHHLDEDIAFLRTAKITPILLASMPMGDTAMVGSEADIVTMKQGKSTTTRSRELLSLKRNGTIWKIVSIRWQSEPIEKPHGG